mmetsp:Transcript_125460/g.313433  ORF Transcript_125460/g.313433 Transcript_125460/m.313433 type:complete len:288 (-) Transcript_125460:895-1758(-)
MSCLWGPALEEVVTLVVHDHECWEVLDFDLPDGLHAQLLHIKDLNLFDAIAAQRGSNTSDRSQVEASMLLTRLRHSRRAVALPDHDHGASLGLERVNIGIHAASSGRPEGARGEARRRLRRARVVDRILLDVIGPWLAFVEHLLQARMRNVASDDDRASQRKTCGHRVIAQKPEILIHRVVQIYLDDLARRVQTLLLHVWHVLGRVLLELLQEDALLCDFGLRLAVRRARYPDPNWARCSMPGQADHAHVMQKVLAAELRTNAKITGDLQDLLLPFKVTIGAAMGVA